MIWFTRQLEAGAGRAALDQQLPGLHRPHLPGALRGCLYAGHQCRAGGHQVDRAFHHRQGLGNGLGRAAAAAVKTGKKVAIVGSGPAGMAAAQQLARRPRRDRVRESSRIGGLLGFGIPDFKLNKSVIDRRVAQMEAEGVTFKTKVIVGDKNIPAGINNDATETVSADS
jgi:putative intracellular protease/amidase